MLLKVVFHFYEAGWLIQLLNLSNFTECNREFKLLTVAICIGYLKSLVGVNLKDANDRVMWKSCTKSLKENQFKP